MLNTDDENTGTGTGTGTGTPDDARDARREFAEECRSARELYPSRSLTQGDLARMLRTSKSTISRVERCEGPVPPDLPARLDQVFETDGKFKRLYEDTVAKSFPTLYRRRMALERQAVEIREWSPTIIPGLFQTPDYARHLFKGGSPGASDDETAVFVRGRITRQKILSAVNAPRVSVVLCESAIRRRISSREVMREQLSALLKAGERSNVRMQLLPLDAPSHLFVDWPVSLLTSPTHLVSVCVENFQLAGIINDSAQVRTAQRAYDELLSDALSPRESARLIAKQMEALA